MVKNHFGRKTRGRFVCFQFRFVYNINIVHLVGTDGENV